MKKPKWPAGKMIVLFGIIALYAAIGIGLKMSVEAGLIEKAPLPEIEDENEIKFDAGKNSISRNLWSAQSFLIKNILEDNGHVNLYMLIDKDDNVILDDDTNSEAMSYLMLWTVKENDKEKFDLSLDFLESKMMHPNNDYMMWRLNSSDEAEGDGSNIATDADLRAIKALLIAEKQWGGERYARLIDTLSHALERIAITDDFLLAPYGGTSGETSVWNTQESWLSYSDFTVFDALSKRRGDPWTTLFDNMKNVTLGSQIQNGLYNSQLTERRDYGNGIDGSGYSINSMWIMVRNAESNDTELRESAQKSLDFYKSKFLQDRELYALYSSNGDALSPSDTPWTYALVGRAAVSLGDKEFSDGMIYKLLEKQITNPESRFFGAFPEGDKEYRMKIGQFTLQESILTLQDYVASQEQ
jgi:endo-1,4-beta-D-glucanase Y